MIRQNRFLRNHDFRVAPIIIKKKILTNTINYQKTILCKLILFDRIIVRYKEGKDEAVFKEKIFRK